MSSRCLDLVRHGGSVAVVTLACAAFVAGANDASAAAPPLRVCAEPDNMPLSSAQGTGLENRLAELIATELDAELVYAWQPQRRGFVRKTVGADLCDIWIGVPTGFERLLTTRPYYRSGYVIVTRGDAAEPLRSLADPRLATLRIGIQLIGDGLATTPPGLALARAGLVDGVVGYPVYGEGSTAERMSADLVAGRLDAAIVWGPQAGWFARRVAHLTLTTLHAPAGFELPFDFAISVGVRKSMPALRDDIDSALQRRAPDVRALLDAFGVPQLDLGAQSLTRSPAGDGR